MKKKKRIFTNGLTPLPKNTYLTTKKLYKVYKDGNHYVGRDVDTLHSTHNNSRGCLTEEQRYFDTQYSMLIKQRMTKSALSHNLKSAMLEQYPDMENCNKFVEENIERKKQNFYLRLKRFRRKANLNLWNRFVTITYDSNKMSENEFKTKLRKCLSNLHSRRGWRYMGVFELGEENNRLHFHALMYIPNGEMVGDIVERKDYSTKQHKMQSTLTNTFFESKFGRSDFAELNQQEVANGSAIKYITKYLEKSGEKIVYSRGIPSEIYKYIENEDVATEMFDFCKKYVFFDDVIDVDKDIMRFKSYRRSFLDKIPNYDCYQSMSG